MAESGNVVEGRKQDLYQDHHHHGDPPRSGVEYTKIAGSQVMR
jgi:hypothetical protein